MPIASDTRRSAITEGADVCNTPHAVSVEILSTASQVQNQEALLLQRDCTTYYVSKLMLFLGGMRVRKVSNSKSDLQGHSRVLAIVPFDRPHTIFY